MNATDVEREIPWTVSFPLPFRVLVLAGMGILGWATNLHGLDLVGVDVVTAMELRTNEGNQARPPLPAHRTGGFKSNPSTIYLSVYRVFIAYSAWCLASWALFRYATYGDLVLVDVFGYIPGISALVVLVVLIWPGNVIQKYERSKFLQSIRRCLFSSMESPIYFADVVFADIFTSFAKVLGDVWLSICMLRPGNSLLIPPVQDGWSRWILPTIMSLPYLVRLRQCVMEYNASTNESRRPLFNALKYATAFPVIFLSAAQRIVVVELAQEGGDKVVEEAWHGEHRLFRLWLLAAIVNSLYSFWWDVTNDWGLDLLKPRSQEEHRDRSPPPRQLMLPNLHSGSSFFPRSSSHSPSPPREFSQPTISNENDQQHKRYPSGLRSTLLYPLPIYPLLVFLNLVLRLTWSIKLSSHLHSTTDGSVAIFWLEMTEVARRWMWVFIRVEWEVIKKAGDTGVQRGKMDDVSGSESDYELIHPLLENDTHENL